MDDAPERPTTSPSPPVLAGGRGPLVAAVIICVVTLPMTVAVLLQVVEPALDAAVTAGILALVLVLHLAGLACQHLPRTAFVVGSAAMLALALITMPGTASAALLPSAITYVLLEWQMGSTQPRAVAAAALGVGIAGAGIITTVDTLANGERDPFLIAFEAVALVAVVAAGWVLGRQSRQRRAAAALLADRRIRDAVAAERARIGRDLHDVVSHSLTVMIAQAEAARVLTRDAPAAQALERVADTGRSAMQGLRRMLGVLDAGTDDPVLEPAPDLRGLARLVERAGSPEYRTSFVERGTPRSLRADVELALFRAAQEALTNAVRHVAPPVRIDVELAWNPGAVVLSVTDDGGGGLVDATVTTGTGLIGMAERVRQAGGALDVRRGRGWSVQVTMPIEEDR
ncbi:sensor histidine kinase [Agromyces aurantiacus]|uniref:histidine kinase n=1 Tax=Agromyces aurantiacus TaxID=165814 RepID=A0ABV9R2Y0_9MICO|nr:histidine kinase [Agromyces aurantiacus]MBM7502868.1 signal transduction histidine kinase [Agromyces aurantiacus]